MPLRKINRIFLQRFFFISFKKSLTQKAILNTVAAFLDFFSKIGVSFLITPILISGLGSKIYGIWQVLTRLVNYMSSADGKSSQALKWYIANHQNSADFNAKKHAVSCALGVWVLLLPVLLVGGTIVVWLSPYLTKANADLVLIVRITIALLILNLILSGITTVSGAVLRGMNLDYKRMGIVAILNIIGGAFAVVAVYLKLGLIGVGLSILIQTIVSGIIFWFIVKKNFPWFGIVKVSLKEIKKFFGLSIWYALWNLVNKLIVSSDVLIISVFLSTSTVTDYVLTGYAAQTLTAVISMMVGAAAPGLGGLVGERKFCRVIELRNEIIRYNSLLSTVIGSMILIWNQSFVMLWVGKEHYAGTWLNLLLLIAAIQLLFIQSETYLIDLTLNVRWKVLLGFISSLVSIGLGVILINIFGIIGICIGMLLGRLTMSISYPLISKKYFGTKKYSQIKVFTRQILIMFFMFTVSIIVGEKIVIKSWLWLLLYSSLSLPIIFIVSFFGGLSHLHRKQISNRLINSF